MLALVVAGWAGASISKPVERTAIVAAPAMAEEESTLCKFLELIGLPCEGGSDGGGA